MTQATENINRDDWKSIMSHLKKIKLITG
jgi:hypothetical protein